MNLPRDAVSILKAMNHPFDPIAVSARCRTAMLPAEHRSLAVQPSTQVDFIENKARKRKSCDGIWGICRILGSGKRGAYRMLYFFMLSCLIFASSVDRGIPSLAAAPFGPATFPLLSAKASSIISFS